MRPGKQAVDLPEPAIAAQLAAVPGARGLLRRASDFQPEYRADPFRKPILFLKELVIAAQVQDDSTARSHRRDREACAPHEAAA